MPQLKHRVAMGQMLVEGGKPEANLARAERFIKEAAEKGCCLIVLPECLDLGWTDPSAKTLSQPIPGPHSDRLAKAAIEHQIFVVAGLVERAGERLYNSAVLIDRRGEILLVHRKINELTIAHDLYSIGDRLAVAETELGTLGLSICADNKSDSLAIGHTLARMGAQLLLSPSAWALEASHDLEAEPYGEKWRLSYGELGRLYDLPVVGVSNVGWVTGGPWKGRKVVGCSLATNNRGEPIAQAPAGETAEALVIAEIELRQPRVRGTEIAGDLASRGYTGP
jgi:predicted amidohydrolase